MTTQTPEIKPFHTFLWKIGSRCNLACTYCYVYSSVDDRWRRQPKLMSEKVARQTATRMRQHCEAHGKHEASVVFHGGEPLLGGVQQLEMLSLVLMETFADSDIKLQVGMQSNGLLFSPDIGALLLDRGMSIGISLDGPPDVNDLQRIDHQGQPTSARLEKRLALLTSPPYRDIFSGFLCVINPKVDPIATTKYLLSYEPPSIDFLLPLNNHDRRPDGKVQDIDATPYADWLIKVFDYHWSDQATSASIRTFKSIIRLIFGASSLVETLGLEAVDLIVIETNGEIEAVDALKSTFNGASSLGYNIFDHDFDTAAWDIAVRSRQMGAETLCPQCKECAVLQICGGGYIAHRYSSERGFNNPSVYSADLEKLIRHIYAAVSTEMLLESIEVSPLRHPRYALHSVA